MELGRGTSLFLTCTIRNLKKKKSHKSILLICNPCIYTWALKNIHNYNYIRNIYT